MDNGNGGTKRLEISDQHTPGTPLIQASGISKIYNHSGARIVVLNQLAFKLGRGETIGIVGASGIGKSTLLHVLGTLDRPDTGILEYSGKDVLMLDDRRLARFRNRSIGCLLYTSPSPRDHG